MTLNQDDISTEFDDQIRFKSHKRTISSMGYDPFKGMNRVLQVYNGFARFVKYKKMVVSDASSYCCHGGRIESINGKQSDFLLKKLIISIDF